MDQMAAYGERDLRRFPHAHVLADQAYALGGKLHRNAEEKHTKQRGFAHWVLLTSRNARGDAKQTITSGLVIRYNP